MVVVGMVEKGYAVETVERPVVRAAEWPEKRSAGCRDGIWRW